MPLVQPLQRRCRAPEERSRAPFHLPSNRYENTANIPCPEPAPPLQPICRAAGKHVQSWELPQHPDLLLLGVEAGSREAAL